MKRQAICRYCGAELDLVQEFLFEVEACEFEDAVAPLELVQSLPYHVRGEPLPICRDCRESIEENRQDMAEQAVREQAKQRVSKWIWGSIGIGISLLLLVCFIAELVRWCVRLTEGGGSF